MYTGNGRMVYIGQTGLVVYTGNGLVVYTGVERGRGVHSERTWVYIGISHYSKRWCNIAFERCGGSPALIWAERVESHMPTRCFRIAQAKTATWLP